MAGKGNQASFAPEALSVVRDEGAARSLLDPLRRAILERLEAPGSSTSVASELDMPRQRVNYHVRELEGGGLLRHVEDRRKGNCVERIVQASARGYIVDPALLGPLSPGSEGWDGKADGKADSFSSAALLRAASETLARVGPLHEEAARTGRRVPALCLEAGIRFRSAREEVEFAEAVQQALTDLVTRFHEPSAQGGRTFRVTIGGHPEGGEPGTNGHAPGEPDQAGESKSAGGNDSHDDQNLREGSR